MTEPHEPGPEETEAEPTDVDALPEVEFEPTAPVFPVEVALKSFSGGSSATRTGPSS